MDTFQIREELHDLIDKADDNQLTLIYDLIKVHGEESEYDLSDQQKQILDERLKEHGLSPKSGSNWEEVKSRIEREL